jgi:hypothetical protein
MKDTKIYTREDFEIRDIKISPGCFFYYVYCKTPIGMITKLSEVQESKADCEKAITEFLDKQEKLTGDWENKELPAFNIEMPNHIEYVGSAPGEVTIKGLKSGDKVQVISADSLPTFKIESYLKSIMNPVELETAANAIRNGFPSLVEGKTKEEVKAMGFAVLDCWFG